MTQKSTLMLGSLFGALVLKLLFSTSSNHRKIVQTLQTPVSDEAWLRALQNIAMSCLIGNPYAAYEPHAAIHDDLTQDWARDRAEVRIENKDGVPIVAIYRSATSDVISVYKYTKSVFKSRRFPSTAINEIAFAVNTCIKYAESMDILCATKPGV